ncbi:hypothetical protein PABG_11723 [Paracoccidioides brasiliensis Pb03]|nr:hypothetical protein PABG_11723 [Paracoccidioides brasiliensis Pb03]ODH50897.1 hypothetical protein GX48_03039 [Paracoccidioides brasiliensis]
MERSMAHHRDPHVPLNLNAEVIAEFERDEEIISINKNIAELTRRFAGKPDEYLELKSERSILYKKKL